MSAQDATDRGHETAPRPEDGSPRSADVPTAEDREALYLLEEACDGELSPERIQRMLDHLADCPECAHEVERLRRMKELVRRSCRSDTAPLSLRERITVEYLRVSVTGVDGDAVTRTTTSTTRIHRR